MVVGHLQCCAHVSPEEGVAAAEIERKQAVGEVACRAVEAVALG